MRERLEKLKLKKQNLETRKNELLEKKFALESKIEERKNHERVQRKQEIEFLEYQNQHLKQFFQTLETK